MSSHELNLSYIMLALRIPDMLYGHNGHVCFYVLYGDVNHVCGLLTWAKRKENLVLLM